MSVAEVDDNDRWQSAVLAVALVSNDKRLAAFLPDHAGCTVRTHSVRLVGLGLLGLETTRGHLQPWHDVVASRGLGSGATLAPRFTNQVLSKAVDFIESSRDLVVDDYQLGFC